MNRKEKIYSYIKSKDYIPLNERELMAVLAVPGNDAEEFKKILNELISEGKIIRTKNGERGRFLPCNCSKIITGNLSCSSRGYFAYLVPDNVEENKVYINGNFLSGALHGDHVSVSVDKIDDITDNGEGHVLKILEHKVTKLTGTIKKVKGEIIEIRPDSPKIYKHIIVNKSDSLGAAIGERVLVELTEYSFDKIFGKITQRLGSSDDIKSYINAILFEENIQQEFSAEALSQSECISSELSETDFSERLDLRDSIIFTIDGDDARDFDDAVSIDILENKNYRLGVHIADVSHYVTAGSPLDIEAFKRGTSIYIPDRVIPMLPEKLSNGICSLNPHEDRLTLSVFMEITPDGVIKSHNLSKSIICSCEKLTYKSVNEILSEKNKEIKQKYKHLIPSLKNMETLAKKLKEKRIKRGSIDFDFPESKIITDASGYPQNIISVKRMVSHDIIEEFMLVTNETIAEYAFWAEIPFIFRIHKPPSFENMKEFQHFVSAFGLEIKETLSPDKPIHPKALQQLLSASVGKPEEHIISIYALRSLMKAEYHFENIGHFGLAAKYYCHFTSPIRRYPDLVIHRILKAFISGENLSRYTSFAISAAKHSSEIEKKVQNIEREISDLLKTCYMSQYIGYIFEAKISSVTEFGVFAELANTVEGFIHISDFKKDYFVFDDENKTLTGKNKGEILKIGDNIDVAVARCDILTRRIDFIPAENATMSDIDAFQKRAYKHEREKQKQIKNFEKQYRNKKKHTKSHSVRRKKHERI